VPVKRHLGPDDYRSWIVVDEGKEFLWPADDLKKIGRTDRLTTAFCRRGSSIRCSPLFAACYEAGQAPSHATANESAAMNQLLKRIEGRDPISAVPGT
jgi:hypothetical protein